MMLSRPLIDYNSEHSINVPFKMCKYHWNVLDIAYQKYFIDLGEAKSMAECKARYCSDCESPRW